MPYILLNPVRAGLCNTAGEWPWSSYRATAFPDARVPRFLTVDWLLTQFSDDPLRARELFAQLVEREAAALRNARLAALRQADLATGLLAHA